MPLESDTIKCKICNRRVSWYDPDTRLCESCGDKLLEARTKRKINKILDRDSDADESI